MKKKAILECNKCGKRIHTSIWTGITAGKNRAVNYKIFNDEINYFEEDANILRHANWGSFYDNMEEDEKGVYLTWTDEQDKIYNLYMRFMSELTLSRKVVKFKR